MRIKKCKPIYKEGDLKTKTFFTWIPIRISTSDGSIKCSEIRWLEEVVVVFEYINPGWDMNGYWYPIKFLDTQAK